MPGCCVCCQDLCTPLHRVYGGLRLRSSSRVPQRPHCRLQAGRWCRPSTRHPHAPARVELPVNFTRLIGCCYTYTPPRWVVAQLSQSSSSASLGHCCRSIACGLQEAATGRCKQLLTAEHVKCIVRSAPEVPQLDPLWRGTLCCSQPRPVRCVWRYGYAAEHFTAASRRISDSAACYLCFK